MITYKERKEYEERKRYFAELREKEREDEMIRREKNRYQNNWRSIHKDKVREYNRNYWLKKSKQKERNNEIW